jgi:hypothetical protein
LIAHLGLTIEVKKAILYLLRKGIFAHKVLKISQICPLLADLMALTLESQDTDLGNDGFCPLCPGLPGSNCPRYLAENVTISRVDQTGFLNGSDHLSMAHLILSFFYAQSALEE